ncbi:hypothetical protein I2W78_09355 [Streptomyces spinoverrucosus]|uniref:hypothetical protein n=1 Tax=Streptomyces spinoverrucosus TaxID=284043 RepID=UPI0018C3C9CC|nr:hypothetical protein [Streptomyces spinoverrucosus]MBG0852046.1 hypothetical protein [Streptomyces spinoverrucosus]
MTDETGFRVGDVLTVACPFTPTRVAGGVERDHVSLEWPWWRPDPDSRFFHWNGVVALGAEALRPDARTRSWDEMELFRTDPAPEHLKPGDMCRVGVPPTVVHVTAVDHFDPPLETGWLPRPRLAVTVLPRGLSCREVPADSEVNGTGYEIHPGDGTPFTFDLLFRPYAFLQPGDEVADASGRAWRFDGAWDWYAFDGEDTREGPEWPLALLTRSGTPCDAQQTAAVSDATASGSHRETHLHWTRLTDATPTPQGTVTPRLR